MGSGDWRISWNPRGAAILAHSVAQKQEKTCLKTGGKVRTEKLPSGLHTCVMAQVSLHSQIHHPHTYTHTIPSTQNKPNKRKFMLGWAWPSKCCWLWDLMHGVQLLQVKIYLQHTDDKNHVYLISLGAPSFKLWLYPWCLTKPNKLVQRTDS